MRSCEEGPNAAPAPLAQAAREGRESVVPGQPSRKLQEEPERRALVELRRLSDKLLLVQPIPLRAEHDRQHSGNRGVVMGEGQSLGDDLLEVRWRFRDGFGTEERSPDCREPPANPLGASGEPSGRTTPCLPSAAVEAAPTD